MEILFVFIVKLVDDLSPYYVGILLVSVRIHSENDESCYVQPVYKVATLCCLSNAGDKHADLVNVLALKG